MSIGLTYASFTLHQPVASWLRHRPGWCSRCTHANKCKLNHAKRVHEWADQPPQVFNLFLILYTTILFYGQTFCISGEIKIEW